jgi:hypothetical protein
VADVWDRKVEPRANDARLMRMSDLGHYPHLEAPQQVMEAMRSFWTSLHQTQSRAGHWPTGAELLSEHHDAESDH